MPVISSVNAEGWSAEWLSGTPPTFTPDSSPVTFSVDRAGYTAAAATTTYTDTRTFTRRKRQVYPNQASDTATTVALDDYVYSTDTVSGVTNNSTVASPKPVAAWVMPGRQMVGNSLHWELVAFHRDARSGRQVACVVVTATDGTTTVTQTVAATAISTLCNDANPVEVFKGDIDITTLATGLVTLNAKVYPWIGDASSVLDSSANSTLREFSPRHFLKNVSRLASPPLAYVDGTSGNDTTGVWSVTAATASATPFATVGGALAKIASQSAVTGGIADGCRIRVKTAGASLGTSGTTAPQNVAAVVVEPDPSSGGGLTWSSAARLRVGATGLTSPLTEGAIRFEGVTLTRSASTANFQGETTVQLQVHLFNCTINNSATSTILSNAHSYFYGLTFTGVNGNIGFATYEHRLMRGLICDFANTNAPELWVTVGSTITRVKGSGLRDPTKGCIVFASKYLNPDSTVAAINFAANNAGDTISGMVVVQNLFEVTHTTTSTPALRGPSSDTPAHGNSIHAIFAHNTITGYNSAGRSNIFYDNQSSTEVRTHTLMRDIGNIYVQLNTKGDVFVATSGADPTDAPLHIGQFAYHHGVGCQGNFSQFAVNSTTVYSEYQAYPGLGSNIGTDPNVRNDPLFTNYQGTGGSGGTPSAGAGGGTYTLQSGSPALDIVNRAVLSFDLAGTSRSSPADAGAYYLASSGISGTSSGTMAVTGTASGSVLTHGVGNTTVAFSGAVTGVVAVGGVGASTISLTGSGAGLVAVTGAGSSVVGLSGAALGVVPESGVGSGSVTISGAATGQSLTHSVGSGTINVSGASTGAVLENGIAAGSINVSGNTTGSVFVTGSSAGSISLLGAVTGVQGSGAIGVGSLTISGGATGLVTVTGVAVSTIDFSGVSTGALRNTGTSAGSISLTGVATSTLTIAGTVTGQLTFTGSASGSVAYPGVGANGNGLVDLAGSSSGTISVTGVASSIWSVTGASSGVTLIIGSAGGTLILSGLGSQSALNPPASRLAMVGQESRFAMTEATTVAARIVPVA